ncbi:hypothetical protein DFQ26_001068 [Actinomortierella ambigua]|nr:hypothetical protein DFQ26_001068 [Actinomortierella ambigua]
MHPTIRLGVSLAALASALCSVASAAAGVAASPSSSPWGLDAGLHVPEPRDMLLNANAKNGYSLASPLLAGPDRPPECPPCFNCQLEAFKCSHFAECNQFDGRFCGGLSDGKDRPKREEQSCKCKDVCASDNACDSLVPTGKNGTCYSGGLTVHENFQQCRVTNRKILDTLGPDQPPAITFNCNGQNKTCDFQFWVAEEESFYCHLDGCEFGQDVKHDKIINTYKCPNIKCSCVPDRMLCGKDGSINIDDFLEEEIHGPAEFECTDAKTCVFTEPAMNDLIETMFGDPAIYLDCFSGECLHYTQVPGFERPPRPDYTIAIILSIGGVVLFLVGLGLGVWYLAKKSANSGEGYIALPDDEAAKLMAEHIPAALMFRHMGYTVGEKDVLRNVNGIVKPGQVMAIMGASGAGKTSLLDILARRHKSGIVTGHMYVNGRTVSNHQYKRVVGYVDQEDTLMSTLTVYETILYSALLRLPRDMSFAAKRFRVMETMSELGILSIKDVKIGASGQRSISGGEKRRVSIACELVTSPSILFLDEPTSGLDSYNAYNVIECLVTLARNYNRTVICTIHQPRSNIFALFDQLVLLAKGHLVYSGETRLLSHHLRSMGHPCPEGFNMADYILDLTMYKGRRDDSDGSTDLLGRRQGEDDDDDDDQQGLTPLTGLSRRRQHPSVQDEQEQLLYGTPTTAMDPNNTTTASGSGGGSQPPTPFGHEAVQWARELESRQNNVSSGSSNTAAGSNAGGGGRAGGGSTTIGMDNNNRMGLSREGTPRPRHIEIEDPTVISPHLQSLVEGFKQSRILHDVEQEIDGAVEASTGVNGASGSSGNNNNNGGGDGTSSSRSGTPLGAQGSIYSNGNGNNGGLVDSSSPFQMVGPHGKVMLSSHKRVSWWTQFRILADRTLKNIYRDPMLMLAHYCMSIFLGLLCGALFFKVTNDIPGFQNRMGVFFFMCSLFGFSCLSILPSFAHERILFVRERANGYYSPVTYFTTKVLFDIVPLRVVPPMLMGLIVYSMVGLVEGWKEFGKFFLVLVLFNFTASGLCLMMGIMFETLGVANLMSSLVMLFSMLFGGLLLNKESISAKLSWLQDLSFFNFAFEALLVNEITYLQLIQKNAEYGLEIDVPGAVILWTFGFNSGAYWTDVRNLAIMAFTFFFVAFLWLQFRVNERR